MKTALQLISFILLLSFAMCKFSISRFQGPPFTSKPPSGVYDLGGLGFDNVTDGNQVLAYGDFNNDKYSDIVSIADDLRTLTVFIYSNEEHSFWPLASFAPSKTGKKVVSVVPGDFNYDGLLDLLVVTVSSDLKTTYLEYYLRTEVEPFFGITGGQPTLSYDLAGQVQPTILDVKGDRKLDVMFMENGERTIQTLQEGQLVNTPFSSYVSYGSTCLSPSAVITNAFANPHSNAFLDLNGDCAADLFITSLDASGNLMVESWIRDADLKFCLVQTTQLSYPDGPSISPMSFGDIDGNGRIDLVFISTPQDNTASMNMHIIYNLIGVDTSKPCNKNSPVTSLNPPFSADSFTSVDTVAGVRQVIPIVGPYSTGTRLFSPDPVSRPPKVRVGDINNDGYGDLLFVINDPAEYETLYGSIVLAINQANTFAFTQTPLNDEDSGYYTLLDEETLTATGDKQLSRVPALYASFFDFDEDGHLGLWIVSADYTSPASTLIAAYNYVDNQNFILKTLGLNGVTSPIEDDITPSLGGLYYGASFECKVTDMTATVGIKKGVQLPQSAYTALELPYMYVGIGKTSNYVENFIMGIAGTTEVASDVQQTEWTPIIPNSQLIVNPLVGTAWTLDVFVNPTSETTLIGVVVLIILVLLGAIVLYLQSKELEKDKENDEREDPWRKFRAGRFG